MDLQVSRHDLLERLAEIRGDLSQSERRVANVVLDAPENVPRKTLAALSAEAEVSEPTVLRFCRSLGLSGFADFKIELAQALAVGGAAYVHRDIRLDDDITTVCDKVVDTSVSAILALRRSLDEVVLREAVERIRSANRLDLYAGGLTNTVASDAQQKFMRLDITCQALHDGHLQTMSAATLRPGDVALAFSYNGRIKDIVRTARTARDSGAYVIALTRSDSPLAAIANLLVAIDTPEDTFLYAPMATRLAHFVMVDLLSTLVTLARGPGVIERLEYIKESLSDQWIVGDEPRKPRRKAGQGGTQLKTETLGR
jgi:RpiR family carbohydrate utilization transcriptional regulator